jgi:hypothetical protein
MKKLFVFAIIVFAIAKKLWTEFMNYACDMRVTVGVVRVPTVTVVGPKVGQFTSFLCPL